MDDALIRVAAVSTGFTEETPSYAAMTPDMPAPVPILNVCDAAHPAAGHR